MKKAALAVAVLGTLLVGFLLSCVAADLAFHRSPLLRISSVAERSKYRVAVLGDAQKGLANFAKVLQAVKKEEVDVLLQTGDLVSKDDEGHYRLAELYYRRSEVGAPLVVVPGNHDIKRGPERFERTFGPLEVAFIRGRVVYLTINNATGAPPVTRSIEERIRTAGPHEAVVLAMHVPPFNAKGEVQERYGPFLAWLEGSGVKYLLCGHVHGYFKKQVGQTTVIVNGVGGDYDTWQLDQKVHATVLEVDGTTITDRAIELPPEHGVWENVEHFAIGHVAEGYRGRPFLCWGGTFLLAALAGFSIGVVRRKP